MGFPFAGNQAYLLLTREICRYLLGNSGLSGRVVFKSDSKSVGLAPLDIAIYRGARLGRLNI